MVDFCILRRNIFHILMITIAFFQITGCSKSNEGEVQISKAEGYVVGYHPCVVNYTVTTNKGKGKGYLVATTDANPDTLMLYGVPLTMFDIPDEWFSQTGGYLLPIEGRKRFKMRFWYWRASKNEVSTYPCKAMYPLPYIKYLNPEYIIVKAERLE